jgi:hypothetical protein
MVFHRLGVVKAASTADSLQTTGNGQRHDCARQAQEHPRRTTGTPHGQQTRHVVASGTAANERTVRSRRGARAGPGNAEGVRENHRGAPASWELGHSPNEEPGRLRPRQCRRKSVVILSNVIGTALALWWRWTAPVLPENHIRSRIGYCSTAL